MAQSNASFVWLSAQRTPSSIRHRLPGRHFSYLQRNRCIYFILFHHISLANTYVSERSFAFFLPVLRKGQELRVLTPPRLAQPRSSPLPGPAPRRSAFAGHRTCCRDTAAAPATSRAAACSPGRPGPHCEALPHALAATRRTRRRRRTRPRRLSSAEAQGDRRGPSAGRPGHRKAASESLRPWEHLCHGLESGLYFCSSPP